MTVQIDKVIQKIVDARDLERVWDSSKLDDFWADSEYIADNCLDDLLTPEELSALEEGHADYIAFRLQE